MGNKTFLVETDKPFSESLLWELNRDYYIQEGIAAWQSGHVPSNLSSNSLVGKTYAALIFGFLKDLAAKGQTREKVYILELGTGHGRLSFHIMKHLERLKQQMKQELPPICYVLSDIVEENLLFFQTHPQLKAWFDAGVMDVAFFDGIESKEIKLRISGACITPQSLQQPIIAIANYFFDSIPTDLFRFNNNTISSCAVSLESEVDPSGMHPESLLKVLEPKFEAAPITLPHYEEPLFNEILEDYSRQVFDTYLFFPNKGIQCLENIRQLSEQGMMLLTMDKGFHEIHNLENVKKPEIITHGSMSIWVNYHALEAYCKKQNGTSFFPESSNFNLELGCLLFLPDGATYSNTAAAYQRFVNDFGPDDFNGFKKLAYRHVANLTLRELIGMLRLSAYDSALFIKLLPRLKQAFQRITFNERTRLAQTMHQTWAMYYNINEPVDLAFEIGGMLYALGYYREALVYFQYSIARYGLKPDIFYNRALCYYQLREDSLFIKTVQEAKLSFPDYEKFAALDKLDMSAP